MRQKSIQYSFEFDKVFECEDHLAALGWPADDVGFANLTAAALKSMAGEGMSAPCISSVVYAYWLNPWAPWWKAKDNYDGKVLQCEHVDEEDVVFNGRGF